MIGVGLVSDWNIRKAKHIRHRRLSLGRSIRFDMPLPSSCL